MNQEIIKAFVTLGLTEKESKVLALIIEKKIVLTRECETICELRQPEVSIALKNLQLRGWVQEGTKLSTGGKGRNEKTFLLKISPEIIINSLKKQYDLKQVECMKSIKSLVGR